MFSRRSSDASRLSSFSSLSYIPRRLFARGWRRVLCLLLIAGLLMVPDAGYAVRAATDAAVQVAKDTAAPVPVAYSWFKRHFRRSARPPQRETPADRSAAVYRIAITPGKIVGYTGQQLSFSALGSNADGQTIQGVQFNWSSSDAEKLQVDSSGTATLNAAGLVWVSAATANALAGVPVLIKAGPRPAQSDD